MSFRKKFQLGYDTARKPTVDVEIDWSNPIANSVVYLDFNGVELTKKTKLTSSNVGYVGTDSGLAIDVSNDGYNTTGFSSSNGQAIDKDLTLFVLAYSPDGSANEAVQTTLTISTDLSTKYLGLCYRDNTTVPANRYPMLRHRYSGATYLSSVIAGLSLPLNTKYSWASQLNGSTGEFRHTCLSDGTYYTDTETLTTDTFYAREYTTGLAQRDGVNAGISPTAYDGKILLTVAFNRRLSDGEVKSLHENPYQLLKPKVDTLFITGTAGGTTHNLLATSVESASTVSSPTITQEHALTATSVESASTVSSPIITQEHTLTAVSVDSASTLSTPDITQVHILTATSVESASTVSSPTLVEDNGVDELTANSVESASTVSSPALALLPCSYLDINSGGNDLLINDNDALVLISNNCARSTGESNTGGWGDYAYLNFRRQTVEKVKKAVKKEIVKRIEKLDTPKKLQAEIHNIEQAIDQQEVKLSSLTKRQQSKTKDTLLKLYIELNYLAEQQRRQEETDIAFIMMMMAA